MRHEPSVSLVGALSILGRHEQKLVDRLDKLLGGIILSAGVGAGLAATGGPALAPLAAIAAAWGWIEQKNEAIQLLRSAVDRVSRKMVNTGGYERRQLIIVAHTIIAVSAYFESFHEYAESERTSKLQITDSEKVQLAEDNPRFSNAALIDVLYNSGVPAPSSIRGYEDNIAHIRTWMSNVSQRLAEFLTYFPAGKAALVDWEIVIDHAVERYRSHYLIMAATMPEFMVWTLLGEHSATRNAISDLRPEMASALDSNRQALSRIETILNLTSNASDDKPNLCAVIERANRAVLEQSIVQREFKRYSTDVVFPKVARIYVNPHYRISGASIGVRPADEAWWETRPVYDNLDVALVGHITSSDASAFPLLLLGHPGAGKSLLTQVLAAQLPASSYTVVRVALRQVGANSPIIDQIQQALDMTTNKRVEWWRLAEESRGTVRVVLLDGLDELLQATSNDRSSYLQEVMEFQRLEAQQERPVVVLVTSRTVVADRVDIPDGITVVRLESFSDLQIRDWLSRWREANEWRIVSGKVRDFSFETARKYTELARQPLLLLMLALYTADPTSPPLDQNSSTAELYARLLDNFTAREVGKRTLVGLKESEVESQVQDQLDRLSVAAFGMFNRGRQYVSEAEIGEDLKALYIAPDDQHSASEAGQRLISEFFFVHTAQARPRLFSYSGRDGSVAVNYDATLRRSYEFLHATFGEYFVASRLLNELVDLSESTTTRGRRRRREPEDDLLFALLSHYPLATRRSTIDFAKDLFEKLRIHERKNILEILEELLGFYRSRYISDRYSKYRPIPLDHVRELAAYSANLVTLRVALEPHSMQVELSKLLRTSSDVLQDWRSTVTLWRAGLDAAGFRAMLATLRLTSDMSVQAIGPGVHLDPAAELEPLFARLLGPS